MVCDARAAIVCNTLLGKLVIAAWFVSAEVFKGSAHLGRDIDRTVYLLLSSAERISCSHPLPFPSLLLFLIIITQVSWFGLGGQSQ